MDLEQPRRFRPARRELERENDLQLRGESGCCGDIPVVDTRLRAADRLGAVRVRLGIGRHRYRVEPGLYRVGRPDGDAPVLVTANYRLSFDSVRKHLAGRNAWILVLDTKGINVWCAAGKGTFGTDELVRMIGRTGLESVVTHRRLVLPQLGAPGISAHEVTKRTGFRVLYGPIRANDIPAYLDAGMVKSEAMRTVRFTLADRLALVPVEVKGSLPIAAPIVAWAAVSGYIAGGLSVLLAYAGIAAGGVLVGTVLVPALLPLLRVRSFVLKGAIPGAAWAAVAAVLLELPPLASAGFLLLVPAVSGYLSLQFTGASVFTSQSGTRFEIRRFLPPLLLCGTAGAVTVLLSSFMGGAS